MRIERLRIENFKGIRLAEASGMGLLPLITLSGRNGVGKSLLLAAIYATWQGEYPEETPPSRRRAQSPVSISSRRVLGPWGKTGSVQLVIRLTDSEWTALRFFGARLAITVDPTPADILLTLEFDDLDNWIFTSDGTAEDSPGTILCDERFRSANSFAQMDFIPAERMVPRFDVTALDTNALSDQGADALRQSALTTVLQAQAPFNMPLIASYLAALDYGAFIEQRHGRSGRATGYDSIVESFRLATGKTIGRPQLSKDGRVAIFVEAGGGNRHSISQLSSGEQEALALMYLVHRLSSRGGILLIDEPEQHLHPSLQRTLVSLLNREVGYSQLWISTHSPGLITTTSTQSLMTLKPPSPLSENQLTRLDAEPDKIDLLADLGIPPTLWQHGDYLVIVEGSSDERILTGLLPIEMSRALTLVAGESRGVEKMVQTLTSEPEVLPWIAIRDRDLMLDADVDRIAVRFPGLMVWPRREIENLFIEDRWMAETLARAGAGTDWGETAVSARLASLSEGHKDEVVRLMVERQLEERYKPEVESKKDLREWYGAVSAALTKRVAAFESTVATVTSDVTAQWPLRWREWVDGKRLLAEFVRETPFRRTTALVDAMIATALQEEGLLPPAILEVRERLRSLST